MSGHKGTETCDTRAAIVFVVGLCAGTGCTIASKMLFETESISMTGEVEVFKPPLFQTFVMFLGMSFALPAHFYSEWRRRANATPAELAQIATEPKVTTETYLMLAIPSIFDLAATCLMVLGLLHTAASVWMLLRGGGIIFVALMKHFILRDALKPSMWAGVGLIGVAVVLVGLSSSGGESKSSDASDALFGVLVTLAGTFVQSVQYTYEEKVMSGDISAPPWLLIGMEGVTGTALCVLVLYPLAWLAPGPDHGSLENPINTAAMIANSPTIMFLTLVFCALVFLLNSFSVLVTYMMSSVWHAILDNFRPVTIWVVQLLLYYVFTHGSYGEQWTESSYLQLGGMALLLFGTAVYNGSVTLPGMHADDLIGAASSMSTGALSRSPLITQNRASPPLDTRGASPYVNKRAARPDLDEPMGRGGGGGLTVNLLQRERTSSV